jgi:hypothetical protein
MIVSNGAAPDRYRSRGTGHGWRVNSLGSRLHRAAVLEHRHPTKPMNVGAAEPAPFEGMPR